MKILVLGATGMAGHMITQYLRRQGHQVETAARQEKSSFCDHYFQADDVKSVDALIKKIDCSFDYIINCVGLLVKDCQDRPDLAAIVNSWFPQYLAYGLRNHTGQIIHISTDCVFDGSRGHYIETDHLTEQNFYGRSKGLGEINNSKDITFRCSIIGPEIKIGTGLMDWLRYRSPQHVQGWTNAYWNGITTLQLAKCINDYIIDTKKFWGIYHLVDNDCRVSKYQLLNLINQIYECHKTIEAIHLDKAIDKTIFDTRQCRKWSIPDLTTQLIELREFNPLSHMGPTLS